MTEQTVVWDYAFDSYQAAADYLNSASLKARNTNLNALRDRAEKRMKIDG